MPTVSRSFAATMTISARNPWWRVHHGFLRKQKGKQDPRCALAPLSLPLSPPYPCRRHPVTPSALSAKGAAMRRLLLRCSMGDMRLGGFLGMVPGMRRMPVGMMGVLRRLLVVPLFVVLCRLLMVAGGFLVMLARPTVMLPTGMRLLTRCHRHLLSAQAHAAASPTASCNHAAHGTGTGAVS